MTYIHGCSALVGTVYNFSYNGTNGADGSAQSWTAPCSGKFKLEVWGAQGGTADSSHRGGYGGYSIGIANLNNETLYYFFIGGSGSSRNSSICYAVAGGFNGGGAVPATGSSCNNRYPTSGGGSTHISLSNKKLSEMSSLVSDILIVAGGGGGGYYHSSSSEYGQNGGNGGGYIGNNGEAKMASTSYYGLGGSQSKAGCAYSLTEYCGGFGYGGTIGNDTHGGAGGGGYYGGGGSSGASSIANSTGGGGSGYIGNPLLISYDSVTKHMTGYNLTNTSTANNTRTSSTTCVNANPVTDCAKSGHGAARITVVE